MKILLIGQLPKEVGGNYTTGAANVVYELSKQKVNGIECYTYGTNIAFDVARKASKFPNQYLGYKIKPFRIIGRFLKDPLNTIKHFNHYIKIDHQNVFRLAFYEDNIREAIQIVKPNLIHVNSIYNLSSVYYATDDLNIPILLTSHGIFYRGKSTSNKLRDCYRGNIPLADAYTGLTSESLIEYKKFLGVNSDKVSIIPNGVDCKKFYFSQKHRNIIRNNLSINNDCIIFITVASVQERKGQLEFIKVLKNLDMDYQYWIIGEGSDEIRIKNYIAQHNLINKIKLLGYKSSDQLYKYYSAADIYVHSSWKEGQSLSELEANATGLRTIVNKEIIGTIVENIDSDNYYILNFSNINMDLFCSWIKKNIRLRQSRTSFDWSVIAKKYALEYKRIFNNKC